MNAKVSVEYEEVSLLCDENKTQYLLILLTKDTKYKIVDKPKETKGGKKPAGKPKAATKAATKAETKAAGKYKSSR